MENTNGNKDFNLQRINKTLYGVSDRELYSVIKEEKTFPRVLSKPIKLSLLIKYYNKYWNHDFTDESSSGSMTN